MNSTSLSLDFTAAGSLAAVRKRLLVNSTLMVSSRLIAAAVSMIAIPIVVAKLGMAGYGTWESLLALSALVVFFQSTLGSTLLWRMAEAHGRSDPREVQRLMGIGVFVVILALIAVGPLVIVFRREMVRFVGAGGGFAGGNAEWVFAWLALQAILGGFNETLGAVLGGRQRAGLATLIQSGGLIVGGVVTIVTLSFKATLWSLVVGSTTGFLATAACLCAAIRILQGRFSIRPIAPTRSDIRAMAPYAGYVTIGAVSMLFRDQMDKVLLTRLDSAAWAGYHGVATRLANLIMMACSFLYIPMVSTIGALSGKRDWDMITRIYSDVGSLLALVCGVLAVLIWGLHDRILHLWIGGPAPQIALLLFFVLAANTVATMLTGAGTCVCKGIGRAEIEASYVVIGLLLNVVLKVAFVTSFGAVGAVAASAISWTIASFAFVALLHHRLPLPRHATLRSVRALVIVGILGGALAFLSDRLPKSTATASSLAWLTALGCGGVLAYVTSLFALNVIPRRFMLRVFAQISGRTA